MPASKVIAKARPTHPSLNFETLRQEGIQYLEKVATEVWTDYNAHDPGITLLELLCYAITDLGYRTQMLPVADLMADPNRQYKPWFTAAEVLPAAPVTGMDYRKLLIDVKGVKNAWVKRATHQEVNLFSYDFTLDDFITPVTKKLDQVALKKYLAENGDFGLNNFPGRNDIEKRTFVKGLAEYLSSYLESIALFDELESVLLWQLQYYGDFDNYAQNQIKKKITYYSENDTQGIVLRRDWSWRLSEDAKVIWSHPEIVDFLLDNNIFNQTTFESRLNQKIEEVYHFLEGLSAGGVNSPRLEDFQAYFTPVRLPVDHGGSIDGLLPIAIDPLIETFIEQLESPIKDGNRKEKLETIFFYTPTRQQEPPEGFFNLLELWYWKSPQLNLSELFRDLRSYPLPPINELLLELEPMRRKYSRDMLVEINGKEPVPSKVNALYRYNLSGSTLDTQRQKFDPWLKKIFCHWGYYPLSTVEDLSLGAKPLPLSGLYEVLLDLDEDIDTGIPNEVEVVVERVRELLHANRALCEDVAAIRIVEQRPIAICLSMDVAEDADELEVVAEAVRRMQTYLSPAPRFRTFAQRLAELKAAGKNYSAEEIYNGPLLVNGFLVDEELGEAMPRGNYQHSDLLREAMSVAGVLGVPALQVKEHPESGTGTRFDEKTTYKVKGGDYTETNAYYKPVIDLKLSHFQVVKGARTLPLRIDPGHLAERLELLRLINATDPLDPPGGPVWEEGLYRPDLGRYRSLQYDLPATYTVGDNKPRHDAAPQRRAQARHLQAYLAFYDQIFASYLAQLERVRRLLSIDQPADVPTRVLPLLYEMPGMRNLITGDKAIITATELDWTLVLLDIREDIKSTPKEGNVHPNDREKVGQLLTGLRAQAEFKGIPAFRSALKSALSGYPRLYELYGEQIEDYFWRKYTKEHDNAYAREVRKIAESPADRRNRRNQLLDHLIARFGEAMGEYASTLLSPQYEPEDNPTQLSFDDFLASKAAFLRELAQLARERNRGYNYRLFRELENVADVWNTFNVSGLQKRVCRKLGITEWSTRSLIAEPAYRFDLVRGASQRGAANFRVALRRRETSARENPREAVPLMISPAYTAQRTAQDKVNELYKIVWQAAYYAPDRAVEAGVDYWFTLKEEAQGRRSAVLVKPYEAKAKGKKVKIKQGGADMEVEVLLQTEPLSADEATNWILDKIIPLVKPESTSRAQEGFHVVEHILLRPMEADDQLLQLHLGCVPEETPRDPYSFWITVVAPAQTTRFADPDFQTHFEQVFRSETPAHIGVRFCYLGLEDMYAFEEAFAVWMFEKARCAAPGHCQAEAATETLVKLLNDLHCSCGCAEPLAANPCEQPLKP